ncbi:MAG: peptidoglycan-binding domain-containing protein [Paracoccaceae bacterium]
MGVRGWGGLAAVMLALAPQARAEDLALVLAQRAYQGKPLEAAGAAGGLAEDLRAQGWSVFTASDDSVEAMRDQARRLRAAMRRTPEPDRVIIAVSGATAWDGRDGWLLADAEGVADALSVGARGLSLGALADIAGLEAGHAAMLIGTDDSVPLGEGLSPGSTALAAPQGVVVVEGPMAGLRRWTRDVLLVPGVPLDRALRGLPAGAAARGYSTRAQGFAVAGADGAAGDEIEYWRAVGDIGTVDALQAYLNRFPTGRFAAEARQRMIALTRNPLDLAREAEEALNLGRDARRQVQRNLDLLGFDPRGIDGLFGRGSRAAIAAWQKVAGYPETGFLTRPQQQELQRQADIRAAELEREAELRRQEEERADRQFWQSLGRDEPDLRRYLERYPDGLFAEDAQARLDLILERAAAAAEAREIQAWRGAKQADTLAAYRGFLADFPNGSFADEARQRIAELEEEAANAAQIEAWKRAEAQILPNAAARQAVEVILDKRQLKPGEVDGKFTRETRRAIRRFQRERGLPVTGFVNQKTMVVLMLAR